MSSSRFFKVLENREASKDCTDLSNATFVKYIYYIFVLLHIEYAQRRQKSDAKFNTCPKQSTKHDSKGAFNSLMTVPATDKLVDFFTFLMAVV